MSKKYYDPEYDREVDEAYIRRQYNWFKSHGMKKSYDEFVADNFDEISSNNRPLLTLDEGEY